MKEYTHCVFIARMQPPHRAHVQVIKTALKVADRVIVLLGTPGSGQRTLRNPWTASEREAMLKRCFPYDEISRIDFIPIYDQPYDNMAWLTHVQYQVNEKTSHSDKIALIGHKKDRRTTEYLEMFPQWEFIDIGLQYEGMSATDIRTQVYEADSGWKDMQWTSAAPKGVVDFIEEWSYTQEAKDLVREWEFIQDYLEPYQGLPFGIPIFNTTDAVVVKAGHVLLVKRKDLPGKGLLALPGGYLHNDEWIVDGMIRELKEETQIAVSHKVLKANIKANHHFDNPGRSDRGRIITQAYYIELPPGGPLPRVKGSDDAEKAVWVPVGETTCFNAGLFSDHSDIIRYFTQRT